VLAATLALLALVAPAFASNEHPSQGQLEAELVCPTCHEPLDESTSPIAQQMKAYIRKHIAAGWTEQQIKDGLVAQLGPGVLGVPGKHGFDLLAWLIPFLGIAAGAAAIAGGAWVWSRNRDDPGAPSAPGGPALAPSLERRVDEELARFE
jgi:cytochrome c-type biogenesis protein CcmH